MNDRSAASEPSPALPSPPDPASTIAVRPLLWLVAAGVFMQMLDSTIVNTALPAMARDLGQSPLRMQAVVVAYALTVAMLIPASGWLADRFGTRHVFIAAVVLFTLGSLACAVSQTLSQLTASRVLQGIGGAMLLPIGRLSVLRGAAQGFPRRDEFRDGARTDWPADRPDARRLAGGNRDLALDFS